jgi:hypothetical protein
MEEQQRQKTFKAFLPQKNTEKHGRGGFSRSNG